MIEFREPQAHNRPDDPELYQPLAHVRVTVAGAQEFRETTTNPEGRFEFAGLPRGQYRVAIYVKRPKRVLPHGTSFHQAHSDPAAVMVEDCPARVSFTVSEWTELISNLAPLLEAHACEGASAWPSLPSQAAVTIRFENGRVSSVRLYWLDSGATACSIRPSRRARQSTSRRTSLTAGSSRGGRRMPRAVRALRDPLDRGNPLASASQCICRRPPWAIGCVGRMHQSPIS